LRRVRRRTKIKPYPAQFARSIDLIDKLGLQEAALQAVGADDLKVHFLLGQVSWQTSKVPPEVRQGTLGESRIRLRPVARNSAEYIFGSVEPVDSVVVKQSDILKDLTENLGLEPQEALAVSIKERVSIREVNELPKELLQYECLQGANDLYHYESAVGDHTGIIMRSFRLPRGFLRSLPRLIRNELVEYNIVKRKDPVLLRIKSTLRTKWILPDSGAGWNALIPIMKQLHASLVTPFWWQDVGLPENIVVSNGLIKPLNAQIYQLYKRKCLVAVQLPEETFGL
jgi:hypothetical protein